MEKQSVTSSNISTVGYDAGSKVLEITFKSGKTYRYGDVPADEYKGLLEAGSVGSYFAQRIKNSYKVV